MKAYDEGVVAGVDILPSVQFLPLPVHTPSEQVSCQLSPDDLHVSVAESPSRSTSRFGEATMDGHPLTVMNKIKAKSCSH